VSEPKKVLNPPRVKSVRYDRNFITTAVCELRFPTLLELESKPPQSFQAGIRKTYPFYEAQQGVDLTGSPEPTSGVRYLFRSKDQKWTVALKSFSLALETSNYLDFEDFFGRFKDLLDKSREMIDSDFFTRVGLRYINTVPMNDGELSGWLRPDLVGLITSGTLGSPEKYQSVTQGSTEYGAYLFRHMLNLPDEDNKLDKPTYTLDFDYFKENVEFKSVTGLVKDFNNLNFSFFSWCIGEKAKALLGQGKPKQ
jgi:uncharacterized protein (TIGR04255 family)